LATNRKQSGGAGKSQANSKYAKPPAPAKSSKPAAPVTRWQDQITFGSTAERVAYWLLHALVFLVPIAISNFAWTGLTQMPFTFDQFDLAKVLVQRVFTFGILAAWGWAMLTKGGKFKMSSFYWLILAFLGWVFLASVFSIHVPTAFFGKYRRLEGFFSFVNYALVFFLAVQLIDKAGKMRSLMRTLFFSNLIVVGYGLLQWRGLDPIKWGQLPFEANRAFSTYGNPDLLGGFLMFTLPICLVLALSEQDTWWRIGYWIGFLATVVVWIVSFVRGAWVGGAVGIAIVVFAVFWLHDRLTVVDWSFIGVTGAAAAGLALYSSLKGQGVMNFWERLSSITAFGEGSAKTRFEIWSAAIRAIKDRPFFGFGPDTFRLLFPKYKPAAYTADAGYLSVADNVHNYPLQLTTGIGIPGTLMLYGLIGWELVATTRYAFDREAGYKRIMYTGIWASVIAYVILLMTGLSVTGTTVFLWLFLGLLAVPFARTIEFEAPSWGAMGAVVLLVVSVLGGAYWLWWGSADYYYLLGRIGPLTNEQRIAAIETAISRNPFNDMYRAELPLRYQDQFGALIQQAQQEQQQGQDSSATLKAAKVAFDNAERTLIDTIAFVPAEYDNYVFLANLYNQAGGYLQDPAYFDKAWLVAQQGIGVEPYGPAIKLQGAVALASLNRQSEAEKLLNESISLDPNFTDPYLLLARIQFQAGDKAAALATVKKALARVPSNASLLDMLKTIEASTGPAPKKK
jgi:O-antigen ligase